MRDMVREHFGAAREFTGNAATNHGERMEPVALAFYESVAGVTVTQTGIVKHDDYDWLGASPDGLIGLDGGLEIKCPYWAKQPYSVHEKPSYYAQCQHVMEVCDLKWMDFFCYIRKDLYFLERLERHPTWFADNLPKLEAFRKKYLEIIGDETKAKAKQAKARRMLASIDSNAGGNLLKSGAEPTADSMTLHLCNKPMVIKLMVWSMKGNDGSDMAGNWVSAVKPSDSPLHISDEKPPKASSGSGQTPSAGGSRDMDDEIPF